MIVRMAPVLYSRFDNRQWCCRCSHSSAMNDLFIFIFNCCSLETRKGSNFPYSIFLSLQSSRMDSFFAFFNLYYCIFYSKFIVHTNPSIDYFSRKKRKKNAVNIRRYLFYCKNGNAEVSCVFSADTPAHPNKGNFYFSFLDQSKHGYGY